MFDDDKDNNQETNDTKKLFLKYIIPGLGVVAIISVVFALSLYVIKSRPELVGLAPSTIATDPQSLQRDNEETIKKVGELILLPVGETPTVAQITTLEQTQGQDFFRNAAIGDKIVVYSNARKAYLYRPSSHKLIEVGIVSVSEGQVGGIETQNQVPEIIEPTPILQDDQGLPQIEELLGE